MGAYEEAIARQERQTAMEEEYPRLWKEIEQLRERAEAAERDFDRMVSWAADEQKCPERDVLDRFKVWLAGTEAPP
jgi:hypothetical protein